MNYDSNVRCPAALSRFANSGRLAATDLHSGEITLIERLPAHIEILGSRVQVFEHACGSFYGTASGGLYNSGAVYCYNAGLSPPSPTITRVQTDSGSVGPTVLIIGTHLIGSTGVNFNGVPVTKIVSRGVLLRLRRCARRRNDRAVTIATVNGSGDSAKEFTVK